ncbi:unnamed protein product [Albugo candida]|uniref:Uncharacterized protein n=1 Tax=Albugo candida TaxID=65357 RepID=A0A024FXK2_9STRA|nr:unnamed protein product [Albugo candida]|eukprot:CCI11756.1 unnamed protein product [Albugo candida]
MQLRGHYESTSLLICVLEDLLSRTHSIFMTEGFLVCTEFKERVCDHDDTIKETCTYSFA